MPLDRSHTSAGTIALHVERRLAQPARGVMLLLAGGPGQASTRAFELSGDTWTSFFPGYTLVTFDPRGTGSSGALDCPELDPRLPPGPELPVALCARRLGSTRGLYSTDATAQDVDAVRAALGAQTVAITGVSYGTRVALAYAAAYPGRTERLVLDSALPLDAPDPFGGPTLRAIPAAARSMCAAGACRGVTADFGADVVTLANRIGAGHLDGNVRDEDGRAQRVELWGTQLVSLLVRADAEAGVRAALPAAVHDAVAGRPRSLLRLWRVLERTEPPPQLDVFSPAVLTAALCGDGSFPWAQGASPVDRQAAFDAAVAALPSGALGRFGPWAAGYGTGLYCLPWPEAGSRPAPPPLPDVPTLVLAGDVDMRTPAANARGIVAALPRGRLLVARGVGHAVLYSDAATCVRRAAVTWLAGGVPAATCGRRPPPLPTVSVAPRTFTELARGRGAAGRRTRTLAGIRRTLVEVRSAFHIALVQSRWGAYPVKLPGLAGGTLAITEAAGSAVLRSYAFAPGVTVWGTLDVVGDPARARLFGALRVCGGRAAGGVVVMASDGRLHGMLGGVRFGARDPLPAVPACA